MINYDPLQGNAVKVFFHYAVPAVIGLLAMSSAFIIDGIFVGNFVSSEALAAVNIAIPVWSGLFSIVTMLAVGSSVIAGKYLGQKNLPAAQSIFSQTLACTLVFSIASAAFGLLFLDSLVLVLGAKGSLVPLATSYLTIIFPCAPGFLLGFALYYFVRVDNNPVLASGSLLFSAGLNVVLDWLFIVHMEWGIEGAAYATGLAHSAVLLILVPYFFKPSTQLKPNKLTGNWREIFKAVVNGFSEFVNEFSSGLTILMLNWLMITRLGVEGVAAFTIVNYLFFLGIMIYYGLGESLQPLVSKNLGAGQSGKVREFVTVALMSAIAIAIVVSGALLLMTDLLISFFLQPGETETENIASRFISYFWPAFIFCGVNICLTAYFTACHKPLQSASIALSRSLILPVLLLATLPIYFGEIGIFIAIPIAEFVTFLLAVTFFIQNAPEKIVSEDMIQNQERL